MKKIISLLMIVSVMASLLCGCSARRFSLKINNTNVDRGIYYYYLSEAENNPDYSASKDKKEAAIELCKKYVAGNELIDKYKISLTAEEKVAVSGKIKAKWLYFGDYYKKYSVNKQTVVQILEHDQLFEDVIVKLYSKGGKEPLSDDEIKEYYDNNYITAQIITADYIDDEGNPLDEKAIDKMTEQFTDMRNTVRRGDSMESAAQKYPEFAEYEGGATMISSSDTSYPKGFFEMLSKIKKGETQVYKYSTDIYLVHRLDSEADKKYFPLYTKECIVNMKKNEVEKMINTLAESYNIVYNIK